MTEVKPLAAILGAVLVLAFRIFVCDGLIAADGRDRLVVESNFRDDRGHAALTCLIFAALGMRSPTEAVLALSVAAVVCIAASNGGTTSQDLKTGYLVGGTPYWQQWAIVIGTLTRRW